MTEQEKLENVINGLECHLTMRRGEKIVCKMEYCPYYEEDDDTGLSLCNNYQIEADALAMLKALDVTPEELERLKMCRAECKIDCLLEHYNKVKDELDAMKKEQEPRVMTWQEVIGAAIECKPLYVEVKDSEDKEPGDDRWAMVTQYKDSITNGMIRAMSSYITSEVFFKDWYGKTWRCWTSRPTDEVRGATPWND